MFREITLLIQKESMLEWRNRHTINGILLYLISTIFICYISFEFRQGGMTGEVWYVLFWIVLLFSAINAVAKSFIQVNPGRMLYLYTVTSARALILSKIIYNTLLLAGLGTGGFILFSLVLGNPVKDILLFVVALLLGCAGMASVLTLVSGIASKAANSTTLMAVLGFPVLLPLLLVILKTSSNALYGLGFGPSTDELLILASLDTITLAMAYLLFPYLWKN